MTTYYLPPGASPSMLPPLVAGDALELHPLIAADDMALLTLPIPDLPDASAAITVRVTAAPSPDATWITA